MKRVVCWVTTELEKISKQAVVTIFVQNFSEQDEGIKKKSGQSVSRLRFNPQTFWIWIQSMSATHYTQDLNVQLLKQTDM
jgi:hypothetical protein